MFCKTCGAQLIDTAVICPKCGSATGVPISTSRNDSGSLGYGLLGFFIPMLGLILYLVWKDDKPLRAKSVGKGALINVIISAVLFVFIIIIASAGDYY